MKKYIHAKELEYYDTNGSQSMLFKIFILRDVNATFTWKTILLCATKFEQWECYIK